MLEEQRQHEYHLGPSCTENSAPCLGFFVDNQLRNSFIRDTNTFQFPHPPLNVSTNRYANPWFAGAFGRAVFIYNSSEWIEGDPEIIRFDMRLWTDEYWFVFKCDVTAYSLTYALVNHTLVSANLTLADDDVASLLRNMVQTGGGTPTLEYSSQLAVAQSSSIDEMATNFALQLDQLMLAFSANFWTPVPNLQEQTRNNMLVTRVPKAPLFTLIVLCLIFVLLGVAVTVLALTGQTPHTREVQARLNIFGVVASRFESDERNETLVTNLENVFEERDGNSRSTRIGVARSRKGGWIYSSSSEQEGKE